MDEGLLSSVEKGRIKDIKKEEEEMKQLEEEEHKIFFMFLRIFKI
jgi:hypothetical protein